MTIAVPAFIAGMIVCAILIFGSLFLWAARQVERQAEAQFAPDPYAEPIGDVPAPGRR